MIAIEFSDSEFSLEKVGVDFFVFPPFERQIDIGKNRANRTLRSARVTINAIVGIDIELRRIVVSPNAIHRANFDARAVFDADARLSDNVGHNA